MPEKKKNHISFVTLTTPNRAEIKKNTGKRKLYQKWSKYWF